MELFKLFQNKIFKIGMLATTGLLFLYFWFAEVDVYKRQVPNSKFVNEKDRRYIS